MRSADAPDSRSPSHPEKGPVPTVTSGSGLDPLQQAVARELLTPKRPSAVRIGGAVLGTALLIALLGWVLPRVAGAGWSQILAAFAQAGPVVLGGAMTAGVLAVAVGAIPLLAVRAGGAPTDRPVASFPQLAAIHAAGSGLALVLPGGGIIGVGLQALLLRRRGASVASLVAVMLAVAAVDTVLIAIALPLVGLVAYLVLAATTGAPGLVPVLIAAVVLALLAAALIPLVLSRTQFSALAHGALGSVSSLPLPLGGVGPEDVVAMRDRVMSALRTHTAALTLSPTLVLLLHAAVLWAAVRAVGGEIPLLGMVAVFALGRVVAMLPLTPGGAGITEAAAAMLLVRMGMPGAEAAAAVLISLVTTLIVPTLLMAVTAPALLLGRSRR